MGPKRVELFAAIRFDWQRNQMSVRALSRKYDVHRRTVRQAIGSPVPPARKTPQRRTVVLDGVRGLIDGILREDLEAPRKQRHTAQRVFGRLCDEHDARVSYSYVAKYVQRRRAEILAEDRARPAGLAGFVPQVREPGAEAQVDFGEVTVRLAGELSRCFMFAFRLSHSGRACHRVYASQAQEAFLEGHVAAFGVMGGLPYAQVRYDNLSPAVAKVLTGRNRTETARWLSFRAHYGFEAFYCVPGQEGAHEKGGVEGEIGRFRRRWFVPVPAEASLAELNARLAGADAGEDVRHIDQRLSVVGEDFAVEAPFLLTLPGEAFDAAATAAGTAPRRRNPRRPRKAADQCAGRPHPRRPRPGGRSAPPATPPPAPERTSGAGTGLSRPRRRLSHAPPPGRERSKTPQTRNERGTKATGPSRCGYGRSAPWRPPGTGCRSGPAHTAGRPSHRTPPRGLPGTPPAPGWHTPGDRPGPNTTAGTRT